MWRLGQKVVYIGPDYAGKMQNGEIPPIPGQVYTIRGMHQFKRSGLGFLLHEIRNKKKLYAEGSMELHMDAKFFRPATDRPTDISIFIDILRRETVKS